MSVQIKGAGLGAVLGGVTGWIALSALGGLLAGPEQGAAAGIVIGAVAGAGLGAVLAPLAATRSPTRLISPLGISATVLAWLLWLGPITYVGMFKAHVPGFPGFFNDNHRVSCLFTGYIARWLTIHYEVRFAGKQQWVEGKQAGFFDQGAYGYRTRLNRLIRLSLLSKGGPLQRHEMAFFIADRWAELYPEDPRIVEVRFVKAFHPIGGEQCSAPGTWERPVLVNVPEEHKEIVQTVRLPLTRGLK